MKGYSKKLIVLVLAACLLLSGCSASNNAAAPGAASNSYSAKATAQEPMEEAVAEEVAYDEEGAEMESEAPQETGDLSQTVASNRKLIRRINMSVETREFTALVQGIEQKVNELGGYMESSEVHGGGYSYDALKSANFTLRVPVDKLDEMVESVSENENANVTWKNESTTDITLSYVDTASRKEAYEIEYERLVVLLQQAEDIDTIVALESRLTDVRYEIQNLESQLRTYDNLVDYATVTIQVSEVEIYTPVTTEEKSDLDRMKEGFVTSIQEIGSDFKNFGIDFVIALPYLIVWAVFIGIIVLIVRLSVKHSKNKKQKSADKNAKEDSLKEQEPQS